MTEKNLEWLRERTRESKEKPSECLACRWETTDLYMTCAYAQYEGIGPCSGEDIVPQTWMCHICGSTLLGNVHLYPRQYDQTCHTLASGLGWIANKIISEIRKQKEDVE